MVRLIDGDALAHDLEHDVELCARALDDMNMVGKEREDMQWQKDCKQNCIWYISEQPTVDAVSVRHGKWELAEDGWYCSACEWYPPFDCDPEEKGIPYCPNCGARMDERKEE